MKKINSKRTGAIKEQVVSSYLQNQGWTILSQNKKILGVEVDIIATKEQKIMLVEVKSITKEEQLENILKDKQKERLKKVAEVVFSDHPDKQPSLIFAAVNKQQKIHFFEIFS